MSGMFVDILSVKLKYHAPTLLRSVINIATQEIIQIRSDTRGNSRDYFL